MKHHLRSLALLAGIALVPGCIKKIAVNAVANTLSGEGAGAFTRDNDLEFVGDAIPFAIKLMESIAEAAPKHSGIRWTLCSSYTQYAMVYVSWPADQVKDSDFDAYERGEARTVNFLERARGYCMAALELEYPGFEQEFMADSTAALSRVEAEHTGLLYWTGASWLARISKSKTSMDSIAELPLAADVIHRGLELDPDWADGSLHDIAILLEPNLPMPGGYERAREHFDKSIALSQGKLASPYVSLATTVSIGEQKREEYVELLNQALEVDASNDPDTELANTFAQEQARWYLDHIDDYFVE